MHLPNEESIAQLAPPAAIIAGRAHPVKPAVPKSKTTSIACREGKPALPRRHFPSTNRQRSETRLIHAVFNT